ncbi:hypothetical protein ADT71_10115 [Novosphingobium sp. ST904]|nr:hypothetical protein ADT71_10115 [Novosphingobium sp. ST904]
MGMILYGECIGAHGSARVRISDLADLGCDLEAEALPCALDGDFSLWIGAIGPLPATVAKKDTSNLEIRFKEPLDTRIVEHFRGR